MLRKILPNADRQEQNVFINKYRVEFPPLEALLAKAERCTESCIFPDQVNVSRDFYKSIAMRAAFQRKYSMEEAARAGVIIDYMSQRKFAKLQTRETAI